MNISDLQIFLNSKGARLEVDGRGGPKTAEALWGIFQNRSAAAVTDTLIAAYAKRLGCTVRQLKAVASVESSGGGYLPSGQPKILWERHYFWKRIAIKLASKSVAGALLAASAAGGYTNDADKDERNDSWEKLTEGAMVNPVAAFESCSWGKFQIMGAWWKKLKYANAYEFAWSMVAHEAGHYEALCRYIEVFGLTAAIKALSASPATCRAFAEGYNGPKYAARGYHIKLAAAMK